MNIRHGFRPVLVPVESRLLCHQPDLVVSICCSRRFTEASDQFLRGNSFIIPSAPSRPFTTLRTHTYTHTHPFNGPLSRTARVSRYQKGKTNLDFTEVRDSEWQWHQLGHMQVCTLLQTDNHASTRPLCFYRPDALPAAQPTASKH